MPTPTPKLKGASIWDTFMGADTVGMVGSTCTSAPCAINDCVSEAARGQTGNVACDMYHTYEEDVEKMAKMGLPSYRFSISWPRLVPTGNIADGISEEGIAYYNALIDALIAKGIEPMVTLYHWVSLALAK